MESSFKFNITTEKRDLLFDITNLSPITNLALNLSGLSTSVAGTPNRRISWSNPVPGGEKISLNLDDLSAATTDSPTFQDVLPSNSKSRIEILHKYTHLAWPSEPDDDKENVTPKCRSLSQPISIEFNKDEFECFSQDSGYFSSTSKKIVAGCSPASSYFTKVRSSVFDDDSMDSIFHLDGGKDSQELLAVPESMSNLLMKPLSGKEKPKRPANGVRRGKLPIRRCLSMEIDSDSESPMLSSIPVSSGTTTYLSSSSGSDEKSVDLDTNKKCTFKRPEPPSDYFTQQNKRRKSSPSLKMPPDLISADFKIQRSYSETAATIMQAIMKTDSQPELVGDGSRSCALPLVRGRHQDLKSITYATLARLLKGEYMEEVDGYKLVDCRYPYEFEGGHIKGAENIYTKEDILENILNEEEISDKKNILIFHCEFSSERAPSLCRFLRNKDREMNQGNYPRLHHPEVYILEGGYKAFFENHKEMCEPQGYIPMKHKDHGFELRHFRAKSKSWGADCKGRVQLRSSSKT